MKQFKIIFFLYSLVALAFLFYSYTQVDLNLTLSRVSIWQTLQKSFQYIGYYQRPLSLTVYLGLLTALFILYFWLLSRIKKHAPSEKQLWQLIGIVVLLLLFSYPAFSYDFFNYMFTAKTVLIYHKNPYSVIPLQFVGVDSWTNFMRWTHLPSAYTPLWIFLTLPPYLLGFGFFLVIMWNIKLMVAGFYLATVWGISKVLQKIEPKYKILGIAIFALNPLVIIESLISAHNDIAMMALAVWALFFYLKKRPLASFFVLALSVALKLMTIFLFPMYLWRWSRSLALIAMGVGFILVLFQREVLPWYFLWLMPFVALLPQNYNLTLFASAISLGLLLRYAPFLYLGHWNSPVPLIKLWVTTVPLGLALIWMIVTKLRKAST